MTTYTITNRPEALKSGDQVVFVLRGKKEIYEVRFQHLDNQTNYFANRSIFERLNLDAMAFALSAYGYPSSGGGWPESKAEDYPALTRLVNALFRLIAEREPDQIKPVPPPVSTSVPVSSTFEFGDRVRLIDCGHPKYRQMKDAVGIVVRVDSGDRTFPYKVAFDIDTNENTIWTGEKSIELMVRSFAPAEPQSKPRRPKVGDRVRLVKMNGYPASKYDGMEVTIVKDDGTPVPFCVELGSGEMFWRPEGGVELIPDLDAYRTDRRAKIKLILDLIKDLC